ncbi:MAG: glycosyltransferase family 4 protein [bacterium]
MKKVLVLGPGEKTRGGITSVIKAYSTSKIWSKYNCLWVETYIDKNFSLKILYFLKSYIIFLNNLFSTNLIHIHFSQPTSAFRKSFYFFTAKFLRIKIILHFHAYSSNDTLFGSKSKLYKIMLEKSDAIIVLSGYWKEQIEKLIGSNGKIYIIFNPCSLVKTNCLFVRQKYILFAGTINERKGYVDLLHAFSKIANIFCDWKVVFAGNGEIEQGIVIAEELKIKSQVEFRGWVSGKDKDILFQEASIFCLPSYFEGLPMAVLDAWSYGIPVVTTPVGGLQEFLIHKSNALVFQPGDRDHLASLLAELIKDQQLYQKIASESLNLARTKFDIKIIENQISDIYDSLLN